MGSSRRPGGATVAQLTPDQKVEGSNPFRVRHLLFDFIFFVHVQCIAFNARYLKQPSVIQFEYLKYKDPWTMFKNAKISFYKNKNQN